MSITIRSDSFDNGAPIPARFTADGENISPPLNWNGLPAGTRELALIVDGRGAGSTFVVVCLRRQYCRLCDEVRLHPSVVAAGATQEAAVAEGAARGFGESRLFEPETIELIRKTARKHH